MLAMTDKIREAQEEAQKKVLEQQKHMDDLKMGRTQVQW